MMFDHRMYINIRHLLTVADGQMMRIARGEFDVAESPLRWFEETVENHRVEKFPESSAL